MVSEKKFDAHQEEDPRRNHGGRMDQGGHGRRAGHGVGQPNVQGKLGGLSDEATGQRQTKSRSHGGQNLALGIFLIPGEEVVELILDFDQIDRVESPIGQNDSDKKTEITDPVHNKSLLRSLRRLVGRVIVGDKQVGTETNQFPKDENHDQVVRQSDSQHREHENGKPSEITGLSLVIGHVAQAEDVNEKTHEGYHEEKKTGGAIDKETKAQFPIRHPYPSCLPRKSLTFTCKNQKKRKGKNSTRRRNGKQGGHVSSFAQEKQGYACGKKRQKKNTESYRFHFVSFREDPCPR